MAAPIRVLIVDDNESMLRLLQVVLSMESDIDVVGLAVDAASAVAMATAASPDVVVLDNQMPGRSGIEALPDLYAAGAAFVIMHTAHANQADRTSALRLGAAVIEKTGDIGLLIDAIRRAARGEI